MTFYDESNEKPAWLRLQGVLGTDARVVRIPSSRVKNRGLIPYRGNTRGEEKEGETISYCLSPLIPICSFGGLTSSLRLPSEFPPDDADSSRRFRRADPRHQSAAIQSPASAPAVQPPTS